MTGFVIQGHILGQWLNLVQISLKHFFSGAINYVWTLKKLKSERWDFQFSSHHNEHCNFSHSCFCSSILHCLWYIWSISDNVLDLHEGLLTQWWVLYRLGSVLLVWIENDGSLCLPFLMIYILWVSSWFINECFSKKASYHHANGLDSQWWAFIFFLCKKSSFEFFTTSQKKLTKNIIRA